MITRLLRINQWYKNSVIFLALIFSGNLFSGNLILLSFLGFLALCLISSGNYIINDLYDIQKDKKHPEKSKRPIAAGEIGKSSSLIIAACLILGGLIFSYSLNITFFFFSLALFVSTLLYTFFLKKIFLLDLVSIAVNFVLRAIAGGVLISVWISPFLILLPFLFALYLAAGKRYSDYIFLNQKKDLKRLRILLYLLIFLLLLSHIVYSIYTQIWLLVIFPLALYGLYHYFTLILSGNRIPRNPQYGFKDPKLSIPLFLSLLVIFFIFYT